MSAMEREIDTPLVAIRAQEGRYWLPVEVRAGLVESVLEAMVRESSAEESAVEAAFEAYLIEGLLEVESPTA